MSGSRAFPRCYIIGCFDWLFDWLGWIQIFPVFLRRLPFLLWITICSSIRSVFALCVQIFTKRIRTWSRGVWTSRWRCGSVVKTGNGRHHVFQSIYLLSFVRVFCFFSFSWSSVNQQDREIERGNLFCYLIYRCSKCHRHLLFIHLDCLELFVGNREIFSFSRVFVEVLRKSVICGWTDNFLIDYKRAWYEEGHDSPSTRNFSIAMSWATWSHVLIYSIFQHYNFQFKNW